MSEFVNYNKRSIDLPAGCKNLGDLLKLKKSSNAAWYSHLAEDMVRSAATHGERTSGTLGDISRQVAKLWDAKGRLSISEPDKHFLVHVSCLYKWEATAALIVEGNSRQEQGTRNFFASHHLDIPQQSGMPFMFNPDIPYQSIYRVSPMPSDPEILSRILIDFLREVYGLDENSQLLFIYTGPIEST